MEISKRQRVSAQNNLLLQTRFDKVRYFGKDYFIKGRMSTGYAILMDIDGNKIDFSAMPKGYKTPKMTNLKRLEARSSWMIVHIIFVTKYRKKLFKSDKRADDVKQFLYDASICILLFKWKQTKTMCIYY